MKNVENEPSVINSLPTEPDVKTVEKNLPAVPHVPNKATTKFGLSESVSAPNSELVYGDNSNSNLSTSSSVKDNIKTSKKRKANSRTPTPNSITQTDTERSASANSVISGAQSVAAVPSLPPTTTSGGTSDRRDSIGSGDLTEKPKKVKRRHFIS